MITLTDEDIQERYGIGDAVKDVKSVLDDYENDQIVESTRTVLPAGEDSSMLYMPCISLSRQISIIKTVSIFPNNTDLPTTQGNILVTDLSDGRHKASMQASYLTRLRTGAMSAIATDKLARNDSKTLGAIGTGNMAFEQVLGVLHVRDIETIILYNRTTTKAYKFRENLSESGVTADIRITEDVDELVKNSDVINCATQSNTPVFKGDLLKDGTHINGVGSFKPSMKEMDHQTIRRADQIYADDLEAVKEEAGELIDAVAHGIVSWAHLRGSLVDIYDGEMSRRDDSEVTLYKCVGAGYFDLAVANGAMKNLM